MEQYLSIKAEYKNVLLLYRMGDFYETFYEDAKTIAKTIGIALTKRAHGKSADVPLAGFPYHALDNYLPKLLNAGLRVAICEQVEDPKLAKGIVKREVVEIASPGATLSDKILDSKANNFLLALTFDDNICGISIADVSTGTFLLAEFPTNFLLDNLVRYQPREILVANKDYDFIHNLIQNRLDAIITKRDDWVYNREYAYETLINHFKSHSLKGYGCDEMDKGVSAAGAIIHYINENYKTRLGHFVSLKVLNLSEFMVLDESTRRNLEISQSNTMQAGTPTLLSVLDFTITPMGGRMMKQWLQHPLLSKKQIITRQKCVEELLGHKNKREELAKLLQEVFDMERLLGKIVTGRANGRDVINLKNSLAILKPVKQLLASQPFKTLAKIAKEINILGKLKDEIEAAIVETPPNSLQEGGLIKPGFCKELDDLRDIAEHGKDWLINYQEKERAATGISSLKISYNKVFGYYLEVTNVHKDKAPDYYIRKQTLVNAERYITPELKEWEEKILGAEDKINQIEYKIFQDIRETVSEYTTDIQKNSTSISEIDCLNSFATAAYENNYIKPEVTESQDLLIVDGRHPVVEKNLPPGSDFIANDTKLDTTSQQVWIITGPNMSGKSTFLRQVGLIVLMVQIGSFVPARKAKIGIVDRIFTRVGASDNLALGESTFLVEMNETANILNNATPKSLILLDEIGRGTSTFDGLSIAWSVVEYIHNNSAIKSKTLFATHYHELTELALLYPRIHNYNVAVEEWEDQVVFLRKIVEGGTDNSYGIYVAQLAGLPSELIERAKEILSNLEANELTPNSKKPKLAQRRAGHRVDQNQINLFEVKEKAKIEKEMEQIDVNNMTPLQALQKLNELKQMIK
ncbi:MAG: DNA mismatch repair protein MutS [Calditrichaeota bacterium]|nr:MAG: DNA mismatch repair protein MutS [Calditrichota bacterium]MBL1204490.1 DNA mismatch repair protein MutS [Calditrichota bacterium]NOG44319.1 DNA mismatch repair protein MutS [Calditrichota bacterium]